MKAFLEIVKSKQQIGTKEETETLTDLCFKECITEMHSALGDISDDISTYLSDDEDTKALDPSTEDKQKREWRIEM